MNCPVCDRTLAATLSICPSCGAMMNDSVREELQDKISVASRKLKIEFEDDVPEIPEVRVAETRILEPRKVETVAVAAEPAPERERGAATGEIRAARRTSPILLDFQNKNTALPDWRLQMQNAVRQRREAAAGSMPPPAVERPTLLRATGSTGTAVSTQTGYVSESLPSSAPVSKAPIFNSAKRRIEESRKKFSVHEGGAPAPVKPHSRKGVRTFPLAVAEPVRAEEVREPAPSSETVLEPLSDAPKDVSLPLFDAPLDTNRLPALEDVVTTVEDESVAVSETADAVCLDTDTDIFDDELIIDDFEVENETVALEEAITSEQEVASEQEIVIAKEVAFEDDYLFDEEYDIEDESELEQDFEEEIDDLAPITMRFNAGLFDLLIGSFTSILILSPFIISGGSWLTSTGVIAFGVTLALVLFVYMTASVTFTGRTIGMRIFSLEMIDVEENEYPSFHQAAMSASIYIVSLALGGLGFVTTLFNPERRALHDLLSGTIIVKEY